MRQIRKPALTIWVPGKPLAAGKRSGSRVRYIEAIRAAALAVTPHPIESPRIDLEIFFHADTHLRADVDNVLKPILDALVGIVYRDDRQVRSVRVTALPKDDAVRIIGGFTVGTITRLLGSNEFLINVYEGLSTPGP